MKVKIWEKEYEFANAESSIEEMFNTIQDLLEQKQQFVSAMVVDGEQIICDYQEYIFQHIESIKTIYIETKSRKEMLNDMIITAQKYLDRALPEMKVLGDGFYQAPSDASWDGLLQLLDGMQWLFEFMNHVADSKDLYPNWYKFVEISTILQNQLSNLEEALKSRDVTLIGDIINFELIPVLESGKEEMQNMINKEVARHDLN